MTTPRPARWRAAVADAHRREWAFVLAATVRVTRDLDLAEECVQDAYARALAHWAPDGDPGAARGVADDRRAPAGARPAPPRRDARARAAAPADGDDRRSRPTTATRSRDTRSPTTGCG